MTLTNCFSSKAGNAGGEFAVRVIKLDAHPRNNRTLLKSHCLTNDGDRSVAAVRNLKRC